MTVESTEHDAETVAIVPAVDGQPVDPPRQRRTVHATITAKSDQEELPIFPAWMRNRDQRREAVATAIRVAAHRAGRHTSRSPKYLAKVAIWSPIGLFKGLWKIAHFVFDMESFMLRQDAVTFRKYDEYERASARHDKRTARRVRRAWWALGVLAVAITLFILLVPTWIQYLTGVGAVFGLAWYGRPPDKPIIDRVTVGQAFIKLTADMTRAALMACGAGIKDPRAIHFNVDIRRDGPGWLADVNLPAGIIAGDIIEKRDRLAAGFRMPKSQVWPTHAEGEHPGRLHIWVADKPVNAMKAPKWPLLESGRVDYFKPFPYGFDERLRPVTWRLDEKNSLFGGIPGSGKSLAVRTVALGAILDPLVIPVCFELKGTGDFDALEELCPPGLYASGADEGTKEDAYRGLLWLLRQCDERGPLVKEWAKKLGSENKVNRRMCEAEPRLRPVFAVYDEVQELFTDKELGKGAVAAATSIIKRGRALGIHLVLATQRIDKESIPRGISSNIGIRLALACTSHVEVELILGTGTYARGARATEFEPGPDSGWGYRTGLGKLQPVRAAYLTNADAARIVRRAAALRKSAGVEEMPKVKVRGLAEDVRAIWPDDVTGWWLADILAALQELDETYAEMDTDALAAALRATGIKPEPIHRKIEGKGVTRYGLQLTSMPERRAELEADE